MKRLLDANKKGNKIKERQKRKGVTEATMGETRKEDQNLYRLRQEMSHGAFRTTALHRVLCQSEIRGKERTGKVQAETEGGNGGIRQKREGGQASLLRL